MHLIHAYIKSIIIFASWCMHHWASIMANASCHMHHFIHLFIALALQSSISRVHHYHGYRAFALWVGIYFVIIPWLHRHKWACFATSIVQLIQIIQFWARMFRNFHLNPSSVLSSLVLPSLVLNLTDIRFLHVMISALWELTILSHHHSLFGLTFLLRSENLILTQLSYLAEEPCTKRVWCFLKNDHRHQEASLAACKEEVPFALVAKS